MSEGAGLRDTMAARIAPGKSGAVAEFAIIMPQALGVIAGQSQVELPGQRLQPWHGKAPVQGSETEKLPRPRFYHGQGTLQECPQLSVATSLAAAETGHQAGGRRLKCGSVRKHDGTTRR